MKDPRLCKTCLAGSMKVLWGHKVGENSHKQRRECKRCGFRDTVIVDRTAIYPREKSALVRAQEPTQE